MLLDNFREDYQFIPYLQTGTIYDIAIGRFIPGINNKMYLNAGLHCTTVIGGLPGTFKSVIGGSLVANILYNYKQTECVFYENEFNTAGAERLDCFVDAPISDRVSFISSANMSFDELFDKTIVNLCKEKEKNKKDYMVESPFINPKTLKPYRIWIPTIIFTDSWSFATPSSVSELLENNKNGIDDSTQNTLFMKEGMVKTRVNRAIPNLAARYGLYFVCTAHIDEKINMNPMVHPTKTLQHMKAAHCFKNVGGSFEFLTSTLIQTSSANTQTDSSKTECLYPKNNNSPINEVNEINTVLVKSKNSAAGAAIPVIASPYEGILKETTNFHYLKKCNYGFIDPKARTLNLCLSPDKNITRKNIRTITENDYELKRALEITAQLAYIKQYWFLSSLPKEFDIPINEIANKLIGKKDSPLISDILNSTNIWGIGKSDREYMSTVDILNLLKKN